MVTILIIIGMLLAFMAGFSIAIKSVQLGLRWQIQTQQKQVPTIDPIIKPKEEIKVDTHSILNEWLNGEG